jgi:membrane-anchored glycerophosphoryl diester phosphodiesterase (GDPDase)
MIVCFVPAFVAGASGDLGLTLGLALLGLVLAIAALLFVVVATVLATPVLVLERSGVLASVRRSWQLTRTSFWRIAGIYLLTSILVAIVAGIVSAPIGMLGQVIGGVTGMTIAQLVGTVVAAAITTPFVAGVIALLYIDIRIRREGLDVELAAAAAEGV